MLLPFLGLAPWFIHCLFQCVVADSTSITTHTEEPSCSAEGQHEEHASLHLLQVRVDLSPALKTTWGFVHIPKAAGMSFQEQIKGLLPQGDSLVSCMFCCHAHMEQQLLQAGVAAAARRHAIMFREPQAIVYSQYLECVGEMHDLGVQDISNEMFSNVTTWLTHFADTNTTFDGGCYNPVNLQSRVFECFDGQHHALKGNDRQHHALSGNDRPLPIDVLLEGYTFVGIVERYQESTCLFAFLASGSLPEYCDCEDHAMWETFPAIQITHGVKKHSVSDLSNHDVEMIDAITDKDVLLWQAAVQRFISDIDKAEQETGTRILCNRQIVSDYMASDVKSPS